LAQNFAERDAVRLAAAADDEFVKPDGRRRDHSDLERLNR